MFCYQEICMPVITLVQRYVLMGPVYRKLYKLIVNTSNLVGLSQQPLPPTKDQLYCSFHLI